MTAPSRTGVIVTASATAAAGLLFWPAFGWRILAAPLAIVLLAVVAADLASARIRFVRALRPLAGLLLGLAGLSFWVSAVPSASTAGVLVDAAVRGWSRTLATTWPVLPDPDLVLFVPLLTLLAAVLAVDLLHRSASPLTSLLPALAVVALSQAYAPSQGRTAVAVATATVVASVLMIITGRTSASGRPSTSGLARWTAVTVGLVAAMTAGAVAAVAADVLDRPSWSLRDDWSATSPPPSSANPLDELAAKLERPDQVAFRVRTDAPVDRWTLAALDRFDGASWRSSAMFRPLGATLGPDVSVSAPLRRQSASIELVDLEGPYLPTGARTVSVVGVRPLVDPSTGVIVVGSDLGASRYELTWAEAAPSADMLSDSALTTDATDLPPLPGGLAELARTAVGPGPPSFGQALQLEAWFRENLTVQTGDDFATGNGYPQIAYFLTSSKEGTSEQFASAYAVLARSLGIPARVVVGFRQPDTAESSGFYEVRNSDAMAWPEVRVTGLGWIPLDPTATADRGDAGGSDLATAVAEAREADPEPVDQASPNPSSGPRTTEEAAADEGFELSWALIPAVLVAAVLLGWLVGVPVWKWLRRRRRRTGPPKRAVVGAWLEIRDQLRDHGVDVSDAMTPRDAALASPPHGSSLRRLGECIDAALWSGEDVAPTTADAAWSSVAEVRDELRGQPLTRRLRAALTPRSLRTRPRSGAGPGPTAVTRPPGRPGHRHTPVRT